MWAIFNYRVEALRAMTVLKQAEMSANEFTNSFLTDYPKNQENL
jgi:hypothetical protein